MEHHSLKRSTRNQLTDDHLEAVLHLSATSINPDISKLVADTQHHQSVTLTLTVCNFFKNLRLMFIKLWDDFNLRSCVAPKGYENTVCGPWMKKLVHHCCNFD